VQPLSEKSCSSQTNLPNHIRVSVGTAIVLGLLEGKLDAEPTTAYLMTYRLGKCTANCGFCPQARDSKGNTELLSRVAWPSLPTPNVLTALTKKAKDGKIKRICIQALNYAEVFGHIEAIVKEIKKRSAIAVSVSCQPLNIQNIERLKKSGVDRLGIALDAASEKVFIEVKGSGVGSLYTWDNQFKQLNDAIGVFGKGNVSTHVIVGLGETEKEAADVIQRCCDLGVLPALFAFTPVRGTSLEAKSPPKLESYRRVQLCRYLIVHGKVRSEDIQFDDEGIICSFGAANDVLEQIIASGLPFRTSGCPHCNRPFYNEKPSGPLYNYPKNPRKEEIKEIKKQLWY
jgi:biotin synthase-related radical SAM superfamily protein